MKEEGVLNFISGLYRTFVNLIKTLFELLRNAIFGTISTPTLPDNLYRDGTPKKYFILSFDDGITQDKRIIEICKKYGFDACSFNINTGLYGEDWAWVGESVNRPDVTHIRFTEEELQSGIYDGFDVLSHTLTHPSLKAYDCSILKLKNEIEQDAKNIQKITGYKPLGMAWPGGDTEYTDKTVENVYKYTSIRFARATTPTYSFALPQQFLRWYPTCSITDAGLWELSEKFLNAEPEKDMLFFVWGHGYELDLYDSYDELEQLIQTMAQADDVVCVTSTEFYLLFKDEIPSYDSALPSEPVVNPADTLPNTPYNVARGKTVTSNNTFENGYFGIAQLTDGHFREDFNGTDTPLGWHCLNFGQSSETNPTQITVDLAGFYEINAVNLIPMQYYIAGCSVVPRDFSIQTSVNGVDWTTVRTVTDAACAWSTSESLSYTFEPTVAAMVRLHITKDSETEGFSALGELQITGIHAAAPVEGTVADMAITGTGYEIYKQPKNGGGYRYGCTYLYNEDNSVDAYFACVGIVNDKMEEWDWIAYRHSPDGGTTWDPERIVLTPTQGAQDHYSVCDPGVVQFGGYYYLAYTSTVNADGKDNNIFVARSKNPDGPFEKWNGNGWGGADPQPIIIYDESEDFFGIGEPSFVALNGTLYLYYSLISPDGDFTMVATADSTNENWPETLQFHGAACQKITDSLDVKYVEEWNKFIAVATGDRMSPASWLGVYESADGLHFTLVDIVRENTYTHLHNAGISSQANGHINLTKDADKLCVIYAYGEGWGTWNTRVQPIALTRSSGNTMDAEKAKSCLADEQQREDKLPFFLRHVTLVRPTQDVYTCTADTGNFNIKLYQLDTYFSRSDVYSLTPGVEFKVYDESIVTINNTTFCATVKGVGTTAVEVHYKGASSLFYVTVTE